MNLLFLFTDFYFQLFLHCNPKQSHFLYFKTQPFVKRKPVKTEKNTGTIAFRFRQVLLYIIFNGNPLTIVKKKKFVLSAAAH
jgi:hypothetical protein